MRTQGKPAPTALTAPPQDIFNGSGPSMLEAAQMGLVQTRTQHVTAIKVQVPRDLDALTRDVLKEATYLGEDFFYAWEVKDRTSPTGKSLVKGMSIDGAMMLLRNWGNDACPCVIIEDTPTHWTFEATFIDYEKGFAISRPYRQRKAEKHGNFDAERALDIALQIGVSKAQRNAIDKGMPAWLTRKAMEVATDAANAIYTDVEASIGRFRKYARKIGVTDLQLQTKIGKMVQETGEMIPRPWAEWTPSECVELAAVFRGIQQKLTTVAEEFPPIETPPAPAAAEAPVEQTPPPAAPAPVQSGQAQVQEGTLQQAATPTQPSAKAPPQQSLLGDEPTTQPRKRRGREPGEDG